MKYEKTKYVSETLYCECTLPLHRLQLVHFSWFPWSTELSTKVSIFCVIKKQVPNGNQLIVADMKNPIKYSSSSNFSSSIETDTGNFINFINLIWHSSVHFYSTAILWVCFNSPFYFLYILYYHHLLFILYPSPIYYFEIKFSGIIIRILRNVLTTAAFVIAEKLFFTYFSNVCLWQPDVKFHNLWMNVICS